MICSEKELGISDEHEGVIILDDDAPLGTPLAQYMGDAVLDIAITPNVARDANVLGVARELAALTGQQLHPPSLTSGRRSTIDGQVSVEIRQPELNPRFVLGLIRNVTIQPSPYWVQRRLRLAGMRPINHIVDATNYAMLEVGQPLHAFDYDILVQRAGGRPPTIITRTAQTGEQLTTLDGELHLLDDFTVLVCDTAGALSIAGVMGGAESEVHSGTRNVLLEGAAWNYINIRRTMAAQRIQSEAGYRFSGVHPAMAQRGQPLPGADAPVVANDISPGAIICQGLVDSYPLPAHDPQVDLTPTDVRRWLGIELSPAEIAGLLQRLEFETQVNGDRVVIHTPDHRLDIGEGVNGLADIMEELARVYGYERIPELVWRRAAPASNTP
jgi:phenylalanyl-tRNA synthetase beta chain